VGASSRGGCYVEYKVEFVDSSRVVRSTEWLVSDQLRALHEMIDLFENENCRRSDKQRN
jgi:hypothetical protein